MENLYLILWLHFFADFVLQSDSMAKNKSSSLLWLALHCFTYSLVWLFFPLKFILFTGLSHFVVDFCTSRVGKKFWEAGRVHAFFVVIGFDQALHLSLLFWSNTYLG